jgi:molybdopterin synthase sulfur carrier subunit
MRVTVRWFASLRERRGAAVEEVELPEPCTAGQAYALLCPPAELPVAYAVNEERVRPGTALKAGDEVVFLPPVGGG